MRVYSYVVASDAGFAPNPFGGFCTLACCKPRIRKTANVGDWIVGLTRLSRGIVYAMRVEERLDFAEYWHDPSFRHRRPNMRSRSPEKRCGDNIYEPLPDGDFRQHHSGHSHPDGSQDFATKAGDLAGRHILVSTDFVYFGTEAPDLPRELSFLRIRRNHRCIRAPEQVEQVLEHLAAMPRGVLGVPARWPRDPDLDAQRKPGGCRSRPRPEPITVRRDC